MTTLGRRSPFLLFAGDLAAFALSLYLTLALRYLAWPSAAALAPYLAPFAFLFALWLLVFYAAGLYSKQLALLPSRLPDALLSTQSTNIVLAVIFFFFVPAFGIAPKTILLLYLLVSVATIYLWRLALAPRMQRRPLRERAVLVAQGAEADELRGQVNGNPAYGVEFCCQAAGPELSDPERFAALIAAQDVALIVADTELPEAARVMPLIYDLTRVRRAYQFASFEDFYEEVFDRVPLSRLQHAWFLEHVMASDSPWYRVLKRLIDLAGGVVMGLVTVVLAPFVWLAVRIESPGPLLIRQERFGRYGERMAAYKFRSMTKNLDASGEWIGESDNRVTRVGAFLRRTSLDEFPQFINVLRGELSLVGPRNDIVGLGLRLAEALPYYEARYLAKPGITGWAQINQKYEPGNVSPQSVEETKVRLAYDFFYLKHRSLGLDIVIALKTLKRMFFRVSSW